MQFNGASVDLLKLCMTKNIKHLDLNHKRMGDLLLRTGAATLKGDHYYMLPAGIKLQFVLMLKLKFLDHFAHYKQLMKYSTIVLSFKKLTRFVNNGAK